MVSINVDSSLLLRSFTVEDADKLFEAIDNSRLHLHPWLDWVDKTLRAEHSLQFIRQSMQQLDNQEALALGIFCDGKIIGGIGMHHWDQATKRVQIGYWIGNSFEGKGIIIRCLTSFIEFLFKNIGLNKIEIHFAPANNRSANVAKRLGFKAEGVIRQSMMRNGQPEDIVIMGLLKNEWAAPDQNL